MKKKKKNIKPPQPHPFSKRIRHRLVGKNKDLLAVVVGDRGDGKSWGCLKLGRMIDPDFTLEENLAFSTNEAMEQLDVDPGNRGFLKPGSVLVLDEAGISDTAAKNKWWSKTNEDLNETFQLVRERNIAFFLTTPSLNLLDKTIREDLVHMQIVAKEKKGKYLMIPTWKKRNSYNGKKYHAYVRWRGDRIKGMKMHPPSKDIRERYEKMAREYKRDVVSEGGGASNINAKKYHRIKKKVLKNPDKVAVSLKTQNRKKLRNSLIREMFDLSYNKTRQIRGRLEKDEEVKEALKEEPPEDEEEKDKEPTKKEKILEIYKNNKDLKHREIARKTDSSITHVSRVISQSNH